MTKAAKRVAGALYAERRNAPRAPVALRVVYVSSGLIVEARTVDISETGMCLQTHLALEIGTRLELRFAAEQDAYQTYRLDGDVMWMRPGESIGGEETYHNGIRFAEMQPEVRRQLGKLVKNYVPGDRGEDLPEVPASEVIQIDEKQVMEQALAADHAKRARDDVAARTALMQGQEAAQRGELEKAVSLLEQAVRLAPLSEDALEELGKVMYSQGNVVRAAALFDRALQLRQEKGG